MLGSFIFKKLVQIGGELVKKVRCRCGQNVYTKTDDAFCDHCGASGPVEKK